MQNTNWADPAAIEDLIDYAGQSSRLPAGDLPAQSAIRAAETQNTDGRADWDYSPCVVARAYNSFAGTRAIGDEAYTDPNAAGRQIAESVAVRGRPVIALIDAAGTYVVIVGVTLGADGTNGPPVSVVIDDPWDRVKDGPTRNDGQWTALGSNREMTWNEFATHFTPVPRNLSGPWSDKVVLMGAGLPLTC